MALDLRMSTEGRSGTSVCFVDDCCVETRTVVPVPMKFEELKESVKEELRLNLPFLEKSSLAIGRSKLEFIFC